MSGNIRPLPHCVICGNEHNHKWQGVDNHYCQTCEPLREATKGVLTLVTKAICGTLYLGDRLAAANFPTQGTRICVHELLPQYEGHYIHCPILQVAPNSETDRCGAKASVRAIHAACSRIITELMNGQHVLVHCHGGIERSPLVVAHYLVSVGICTDLANAYQYLKKIRPCVADRRSWLP